MIGFVNVNKPSGMSSSKVVTALKKIYHISKIGHMGTLDPLAEGVLPIAVGKATRMFDYFLEKHKTYIAEFTFGLATDTLDSEGQVVDASNNIPTRQEIVDVLDKMIGTINQVPPQFSAKKVNGRCAYELARNGQEVDLKPKQIEIYSIKLLDSVDNRFKFEIECSSGTYIRSIARDMAELVNSKAYMSALTRTKSGKFVIEKSFTIEQLKESNLKDVIVGVEDIFDFPICELSTQETKDLLDGKNIKVNKINGQYFIKCDNILIGIGFVEDSILKLKTYLKEDL